VVFAQMKLPSDPLTLILWLSAFFFVCSSWGAATLIWLRVQGKQRDRLISRILVDKEPAHNVRSLRLWNEGSQKRVYVKEQASEKLVQRLRVLMQQAGWSTPLWLVIVYTGIGCATVAMSFYTVIVKDSTLCAVMAGAAVPCVTYLLFRNSVDQHRALLEQQMIDGLELCGRALRAGHPLIGALQLVSEEVPDPLSRIFSSIVQKQAMGISLRESVMLEQDFLGDEDFRLFSAAIMINTRSGGSLVDMIEGIARVIRDRQRLGRRFKTLVAQTQYSKRVLLFMPPCMFVLLSLMDADYMNGFKSDPSGSYLLTASGVLLGLGWMVMNKMCSSIGTTNK
jgi:tight adherence protein B